MANFSPDMIKRNSLPALLTLGAVVGSAWVYAQKAPRIYETSSRIMLDDRSKSVSELGRALTKLPDNVPGGSSAIVTQAELVKSERVLKRALESILPPGMSEDPDRRLTVAHLSKTIRVKILPATNLLEVSYQNTDAKLVADVINAVADATVIEDVASIRREASTVREFLEKKVPAQQSKVLEAEALESQYRQGTGIVSLENQTQSLVVSLADVENQERLVTAQLREASTKGGLLQGVTGVNDTNTAYAANRIGQDEQLKLLRTRIAEAENKVIEIRSRLGDQHPDLLAAIEQRNGLKKLQDDRISSVVAPGQAIPSDSQLATDESSRTVLSQYITGEVERTALEEKLQTLQAAKANLRDRIAQLPAKQQGLTAVTREREEASVSLKGLQSKLEEARVAEAQLISNIRILDRAKEPKLPSSPNSPIILALAIAAGLLLSVATILLRELLDNTLRHANEIPKLTNLPVLGKIPKLAYKPSFDRLEQFLDTPHLVEPYRMLLKALDRKLTNQPKVILISSTVEGEGKSNLVAYLGAVAATLSWKTLVIDADLQHPVQHAILGVSASPGLCNAIVTPSLTPEVVKSTVIENLFVMPYGEFPTRPATITESSEMPKLLANLSQQFDLILIDTTVLSKSVDAVTLSKYASGLLLTACPNHTRRDLLKEIILDLKDTNLEPLGIVINHNADHAPSKISPLNLTPRLSSLTTTQKSVSSPLINPIFPSQRPSESPNALTPK
jgi:polysaccharide biosynthesis transport protein